MSVCYCVVERIPFLCDLIQLALIKSHLGAFDFKAPVSRLSNQTVTQAAHEQKIKKKIERKRCCSGLRPLPP